MPGTRITDQQVTIYMTHRKRNSQVVAAAKAGISERSARRLDKANRLSNEGKRQWRTRNDPLEAVWGSIVIPILEQDKDITPVGVFDHLCEYHTDKFSLGSRRTLSAGSTNGVHYMGLLKMLCLCKRMNMVRSALLTLLM